MSDILVIVPTRGIVFTRHQQALEDELADIGEYPQILRTEDVPLPESRNMLVESALKLPGWKYLLMVDDDIVMPEGSLKAMVDVVKHGSDVAVIDYPHHLAPVTKERVGVAVYETYRRGEKVDGKDLAWAGLGCVLVTRKALEKLEEPFFQNSAFQYERDDTGKIRMDGQTRNNLTASSGEDVYFFFNCRKANLRVKVLHEFCATHARIEKFVYRLASGRYRQTHEIQYNDRFDYQSL